MASLPPPSTPSGPSALAIAFAAALVAGVSGYFIGQASTLSISPPTRSSPSPSASPSASEDEGDLTDKPEALAGGGEECKLVLVVRSDLGMTKGKMAAQCSHATLACYKRGLKRTESVVRRWERQGQAKVALQTKGEDELLTLQATAASLGLTAQVVHDAGRTQIAAGSATVLGVGPGPKSVVDRVTGGLKLL